MGVGIREDLLAHPLAAQGHGLGAELLGEPHRLDHSVAGGLRKPCLLGSLHVRRDPRRAEAVGHPLGGAHEPRGRGTRPQAHEQPFAGGPGLLDRVLAHVHAHLRVDALGGATQGELAQGNEVALAEKVTESLLGELRNVDLALLEALQEVIGRKVDQLDLVGLLENGIRYRLLDDDAGDLGDDVVEALHVLDVDGGVHVDAGGEQLIDVLPALGMTRARGVGVGELVDQDQRRPASEGAVEVEVVERRSPVLDRATGKHLEALEQRFRLDPAMRLHETNDDVHAVITLFTSSFQHGVRLADAGGRTEEHLQLATAPPRLFFLDPHQERVGIGPSVHGP